MTGDPSGNDARPARDVPSDRRKVLMAGLGLAASATAATIRADAAQTTEAAAAGAPSAGESGVANAGSAAQPAHRTSRLDGRVALVTGGGTGIGQAAALAYARAGAKVVVAGRRQAELETTVALIEADGGQGLAVPTDVSVARDIQALIQRTVKKFGGLDIAFNNAGTTGHFAPIREQHQPRADRHANGPRRFAQS